MSPRTSIGWVEILSTDPPVDLLVRLSPDPITVDAGYGGWTEVARPRRKSLSVWTGSPSLRMTLSIVIDRYREGDSIEQQIAQLERLGLPSASDGAPPRVRIKAQGGGVPYQDRVWVVDTLSYGDRLVNQGGDRSRQQVTLALLEYVRDVRVDEDSAALRQRLQAATPKTKAGAGTKRVTAKAKPTPATNGGGPSLRTVTTGTGGALSAFGGGEDLLTIAARELGSADRWLEIAQLNDLRDPRAITPGQVLRLP